MDLAVTASSFSRLLGTGDADMAAVIRGVRDLGIRRIELMDRLIRPAEGPSIQKALAETGVAVAGFDVFCDIAGSEPGDRAEALAQFHRSLREAAAFGARHLMVIPDLANEAAQTPAARRAFCQMLCESLAEADRLNLALTIENLGFLTDLYGHSEQLLEMCDAVGPQLGITFDAGNFLLAGEDSQRALAHLFPKVVQVHFKDWKPVPANSPSAYPGVDGRHYQGAALGEGSVNLAGVARQLKERGYAGVVAIEYEGPEHPLEAIGRGLAHLRTLGIADG
jgi:sugar phosphate isomerase/epimerase